MRFWHTVLDILESTGADLNRDLTHKRTGHMLQVIEWNDDEGNQVLAVSEDAEKLKDAASKHSGDELTWEEDSHNPGSLVSPHEYGRMYSIESITVL